MELPDHNVCYRALQSRDARFDGMIFVGITTTGIYCRPICPARTPLSRNCVFFSSAAAAQTFGLRPCLRCRPEIAPDLPSWRGTSNTVSRALAMIAEGALDGPKNSVDALAVRLGLGERQLRRLFLQHVGVSPVSVAQTRRVLFAKRLIHDTRMSMSDVATAAGFSSLRRFNESFLELFDRPPSALRTGPTEAARKDDIVLKLAYRTPYDWESMLAFLGARAVPGVEVVENNRYLRAVQIAGSIGTIAVAHTPNQQSLVVSIRFPEVRSLPAIVSRVRRVFDLNADIQTIDRHLSADTILAGLVARRPGLRAPGGWDGFETATRAVLGQQITVGGARKLAAELVREHGRSVPSALRIHPTLTHVFPLEQRVASAATLCLGLPASRSAALQAIARAAVADPNLFDPTGELDQTTTRLRAIRGIGEWTAQYIALRAVRETDAFPWTDVGLLRGAAAVFGRPIKPAELLDYAESWRPWRAYAAQHLWTASAVERTNNQAPAEEQRHIHELCS